MSPVYDNNGYYMGDVEILQMRDGGRDKNEFDQTINQLKLIFEPIKNWNITVDGNIKTETTFNHQDVLPIYGNDINETPYLEYWNSEYAAGQSFIQEYVKKHTFLTTNIYTDYSKSFDSGHYLKVMAGFNSELLNERYFSSSKNALISANIPTLDKANENDIAKGGYGHWSTAGFFGRINYNYKERYMLEANIRYDGTSRFIGDRQWGLFPSFSAGWNIAREDFFVNSSVSDYVNTIKLRGSWGQLGNTNTKEWYPFYQDMPTGNQNGGWLIDGTKPNTSEAPSIVTSLLTWETVESWNIGLDFAIFNNRLSGYFDYFKRNTKNMIGPAPELSSILGTDVPKINNADMESFGFELEIGWNDNIGDVNYGVKLLLSDDQQRVARYPNEKGTISSWYNNKMSGEIWGYETIGIAKTDEQMNAHLATLTDGGQSSLGSNWSAGDIMYNDLNGDGKIDSGSSTLDNPGDRKIIGNSTPRYKYGIILDAAWKGLDFRLFLQGVGKRDFWLGGPYFWGASSSQWQSVGFVEHMDFFRPEGDEMGANINAYYPRPLFGNGKNQQVQSGYLQDASYIRLKNIQLGYTIPRKLSQKIKLQMIRLYISADNLWTSSDISGIFDPEALGGGWGEGKLYPLQKTISIGLNVSF